MHVLSFEEPRKNKKTIFKRKKKECVRMVWRSEDDFEIKLKGRGPGPRYDHSMVNIGSYLVILGGRTFETKEDGSKRVGFADSIFALKLDDMQWINVKPIDGGIQTKLLRSEF